MNIDFSTINAYLALIAVVINFTFALLAIVRTSRETVYITFALVCIGVAWWNFWDLMVFATGNPVWNPVGIGATTPWKNIVSIGSTLAVAAMFHFTLAVVDKLRQNRRFIVLAYMLAIPIGVLPSFAGLSETVYRFYVGPGWNLTFFILQSTTSARAIQAGNLIAHLPTRVYSDATRRHTVIPTGRTS